MTNADGRIATLAALLAPERAEAMLGRLGSSRAEKASLRAKKLLAASRADRLGALAAALSPDHAAVRARAGAAASSERVPIAGVLRALAADAKVTAHPIILRVCRELIGR